jgi:hypothetical protein
MTSPTFRKVFQRGAPLGSVCQLLVQEGPEGAGSPRRRPVQQTSRTSCIFLHKGRPPSFSFDGRGKISGFFRARDFLHFLHFLHAGARRHTEGARDEVR